jgi:hypothetical protein
VLGIEPSQRAPKARVLPVYDTPVLFNTYPEFACLAQDKYAHLRHSLSLFEKYDFGNKLPPTNQKQGVINYPKSLILLMTIQQL